MNLRPAVFYVRTINVIIIPTIGIVRIVGIFAFRKIKIYLDFIVIRIRNRRLQKWQRKVGCKTF